LERILELNAQGLAIVLTSHDPNHAYLLNSKVICLVRDGRLVWGNANETLDEALLYELYGVPLERDRITSQTGQTRCSCQSYLKIRE
jgi:iron complex transport system ATP-binding protein